MKFDDGFGPYDYCKRGLSHCDDQFCSCIDNVKYRAYYQMARHRMGWNKHFYPKGIARWLASWALGGAALGMLILLALYLYWDKLK